MNTRLALSAAALALVTLLAGSASADLLPEGKTYVPMLLSLEGQDAFKDTTFVILGCNSKDGRHTIAFATAEQMECRVKLPPVVYPVPTKDKKPLEDLLAKNLGWGAEGSDEMTSTVFSTAQVEGGVASGRGPRVEIDAQIIEKDKEVVEKIGGSAAETMIKTEAKADVKSDAKAEVRSEVKVDPATAGAKLGSGKETMALAGKTLNELETVRLAPPLSALQPRSPKVEVDVSVETRDREEVVRQNENDGSAKPPEDESKK